MQHPSFSFRELLRAAAPSALLALLSLAFAWALPSPPAAGQEFWGPCSSIAPGGAVPAGYGAPYDVVGNTGALLISGKCTLNEPRVRVSVGDGRATTYIYQDSYFWNGVSWEKVFLGGAERVGAWFKGRASATLRNVPAEVWYAAYVCQWDGAAWQCGCRTAGCTQRFWQIQRFTRPIADLAPAGASEFRPFPAGARAAVAFDTPLSGLGVTAGAFLRQLNEGRDPGDRLSLCDLRVYGLVADCERGDAPFAPGVTWRTLGFSYEAFADGLMIENQGSRIEVSYFDPQQKETYLLAATFRERDSGAVRWELLPLITDEALKGRAPERKPSSYIPEQAYTFGMAYVKVFLEQHVRGLRELPNGAQTDLPLSYGE